jgi:hypothetical protein
MASLRHRESQADGITVRRIVRAVFQQYRSIAAYLFSDRSNLCPLLSNRRQVLRRSEMTLSAISRQRSQYRPLVIFFDQRWRVCRGCAHQVQSKIVRAARSRAATIQIMIRFHFRSGSKLGDCSMAVMWDGLPDPAMRVRRLRPYGGGVEHMSGRGHYKLGQRGSPFTRQCRSWFSRSNRAAAAARKTPAAGGDRTRVRGFKPKVSGEQTGTGINPGCGIANPISVFFRYCPRGQLEQPLRRTMSGFGEALQCGKYTVIKATS